MKHLEAMAKSTSNLQKEEKSASTLNFKILNNAFGWAVFGVALVTYFLTMERTASFWDCGEFIACSYKLEIMHPPGAPFFMLVSRMFSLLAGGDTSMVAYWINFSSALYSAFTILFLFWSITLFGAKLLPERNIHKLNSNQILTLMSAGLVGSLAYTFSDSFWFSAVEAEVYAMSSFFTAFVVWAMLKWELIEDESDANRWIILMAYMMGLSIGVHLLNLVTIPALGLIYYYKKYKNPNLQGVMITMAISGAIIIFILEGIIPGLPTLAGNFEIFLVNTIGLPFGAGAVFVTVAIVSALVYGIIHSIRTEKVVLNTALVSLAFILIGYVSYGIIIIRANYNPPINENDPSDIIKFVSYLKREQYGDRPLSFGPSYKSDVKRDDNGAPIQISKGKLYRMVKEKGKYEIYDERKAYDYEDKMLLPRIYSRQDNHKELYESIIFGEEKPEDFKPKMSHNLYFMFKHQLGHMYFRYFLWNFAGRESDIQDANFITGFESTKDLPEELKNNKARNAFYLLPLILGLIGLVFTYLRSQQTFFITMLLFFLTGIALVLYLNSPPVEPRERDYIYAGSFYAFAMWIGFSVIFLAEIFKVFYVGLILTLPVTLLMAQQGWDDHDRSKRYHSVDSAKNLLNSCAPNAILFTGGDNDTFPLWYVQEVEGFRTDVRVCNLSLLGTDWYIDQMKRKTYKSDPLPISLDHERYLQGRNDQLLYPQAWRIETSLSPNQLKSLSEQGMDLKVYLEKVNSNDAMVKAQIPGSEEEDLTIFPSKKMVYKFNKAEVLKKGFVPKDKESLVGDAIAWELQANELLKNDLLVLDMIATNNWERPIYFSSTLANSSYLNMKEFMQMEGLTFRLMPFKVTGEKQGFVNSDLMYENMTKKFFWRELANPKVYYDENYLRFTLNIRNSFYRLATQLIREGKEEKAKKALLFAFEKMPDKSIPYDVYTPQLVDAFFKVKEDKRAMEIAITMADRAVENLKYVLDRKSNDQSTISTNYIILNQLVSILEGNGKTKEAKKYKDKLEFFMSRMER